MQTAQSAEILRIHISESDRFGDKPLYEAIVARFMNDPDFQRAVAARLANEAYERLGGVHPASADFHPDFFVRFSADEIPRILDEWRFAAKVRAGRGAKMVVNANGLWRDDGTRW